MMDASAAEATSSSIRRRFEVVCVLVVQLVGARMLETLYVRCWAKHWEPCHIKLQILLECHCTDIGVRFRCRGLTHQRLLNEDLHNAKFELKRNLQALEAHAEQIFCVQSRTVERWPMTLAFGVQLLQMLLDESSERLVCSATLQVGACTGVHSSTSSRTWIVALASGVVWIHRRPVRARAHFERLQEHINRLDGNYHDFVFSVDIETRETRESTSECDWVSSLDSLNVRLRLSSRAFSKVSCCSSLSWLRIKRTASIMCVYRSK